MAGLIAVSGLGGCGCARGTGDTSVATSAYPLVTYVAGGILVLAFGFALWGDSKVSGRRQRA